jgi:hypothetical protein
LATQKQSASNRPVASRSGQETSARIVSPRDRLKAALSDDSRKSRLPDKESPAQDRLRLRVESLMGRARHHLERNELPAAQLAVELAQNLAESGELEFAPDEERPIDLLTLIVARREADVTETSEETLAAAKGVDDAHQRKPRKSSPEGLPTISPAGLARPAPQVDVASKSDPSFDPYANRNASVRTPEDQIRSSGVPIVRLEAPTFGDDSEGVNTTSFVQPADRTSFRRSMSSAHHFRRATENLEEIPMPPCSEGPSLGEADATAPTVTVDGTLSLPLEATESPQSDSITLSELPSVLDDEDDEAEIIRPAGSWPRWVPLSFLSVLTAGFCAWLAYRRKLPAA